MLIPFFAYLHTLQPGLGGSGDNAKFQFIGRVLGIPHSPGYPGYVMLNALFARLPFGVLAYRINLMSALFGALAVGTLFWAALELDVSPFAAALSALLFGTTRFFWDKAVVAEVYTLNAFYVAATLLALFHWRRSGNRRMFYLACLIYALSFGNHLTMITLLPAFAFLVICTDRSVFHPRSIVIVTLLVLLGAAQYGYIAVRAFTGTPYSEFFAPLSAGSLLSFAMAGQYRDFVFGASSLARLQNHFALYLHALWSQFTPFALIFIGWGIAATIRSRPRLAATLGLAWAGELAFAINFVTLDIGSFFIPTFLVLSLFFAVGFDHALHLLQRYTSRKPFLFRHPSNLLALSMALLVALLGYRTSLSADQSGNVQDAARMDTLFNQIAGHSLLLTGSYRQNTFFLYKLLGENVRQGDEIYAAVTFDPASLVKRYRSGEKGLVSGYGSLDAVPRGLQIYDFGNRPERLRAAGYTPEAVQFGDGDLRTLLEQAPDGAFVLLAIAGEGVNALDERTIAQMRSLGLHADLLGKEGWSYVAVGRSGWPRAGHIFGWEKLAPGPVEIAAARGALLDDGTPLPADILLFSRGTRARGRLSGLRDDLLAHRWRRFWDDLRIARTTEIRINGTRVSQPGQGLQVVIMDSSARVLNSFTIDTHTTLVLNGTRGYKVPERPQP
ncbi:MAG: DUF2723 domain-containing protein [Chloroflexi bacterium]|nr:DUF2723 domain-containing protein [Chloroflexota bacterium]